MAGAGSSDTVLCVQPDCPAQRDCCKCRDNLCMAYRKHPDNHPASGIFCLPSAVQKEEPDRKDADSGFGITKLIKPLTFFGF